MHRTFVLVVCFAAALSAALVSAQQWPQWRGPARDGASVGFTPPAAWPDQLTRAWTTKVGVGHSSPVVAGDRVFVFSRVGDREVVSALALATGQPVWREEYDAPYTMNPAARRHGPGPKSTPVAADRRVCALGISGILSCVDAATGELRWRKDFRGEFRETSALYGTAMSPVVDRGLLVAHVGGPGGGALTAFDHATGAVRWRWTNDGPGYASPIVVELGGVRQIVTQSEGYVVGIAAADGSLLWQIPLRTPFEQNIVTPIVFRDLVIYSGLDRGVSAARIAQKGAAWAAEPVWHNADVSMYMNSPVLSDGVVFGLSHRNSGQFFGLDAETGKTLWTTKGREGANAAIVHAGSWLFALTDEAALIVARKSRTLFDEVKRYTVADSPTWAHPALVTGGVLIKDLETITLWKF